jgi:hypothetical protein
MKGGLAMRVLNQLGQVIGTMDHEPKGNAFHFKHGGIPYIFAYEWFWIDEEGNPQGKVESDEWGIKYPKVESKGVFRVRMEYFYYLNTEYALEIATSLPGWKGLPPKRIIERPTI